MTKRSNKFCVARCQEYKKMTLCRLTRQKMNTQPGQVTRISSSAKLGQPFFTKKSSTNANEKPLGEAYEKKNEIKTNPFSSTWAFKLFPSHPFLFVTGGGSILGPDTPYIRLSARLPSSLIEIGNAHSFGDIFVG